MSCMPSVSQVEFSRQAKAPQPTWRALLRQRATSAVGTENEPSAGEPTAASLGITELVTQGLPGFQLKYAANKREFSYFGDSQKTYSHSGANSDLTGDWTPYNYKSLTHYLALLCFSLGSDLYSTVWFFSEALGRTAPEIPKSFLKIVGMSARNTHKYTLVCTHTQTYTTTRLCF